MYTAISAVVFIVRFGKNKKPHAFKELSLTYQTVRAMQELFALRCPAGHNGFSFAAIRRRIGGECPGLKRFVSPNPAGTFAAEWPAFFQRMLKGNIVVKENWGLAIPAWFRSDNHPWKISFHKNNLSCTFSRIYA
jgi:hypothetical protein